MKPEIIDMHSHYFPQSYYKLLSKYGVEHPDNVFVPEWSVEKQLSNMNAAGIIYTLVSITSPYFSFMEPESIADAVREVNEEGAAIVAQNKERLGLLASLPLPNVEASVNEVIYDIEHLGVCGFGLPTHANGVYLGNPILDPVMEILNEKKALVTLHPTSPAKVIENVNETLPIPLFEFFVDSARAILNMVYRDIFKRYPDIKFIMPHAGGCFSTMIGRLSSGAGARLDIEGNLKRMYFDLAGSPFPVQLEALLPIVGAEHLVYGIDFPYAKVYDADEHTECIKTASYLNDIQRELIFNGNAKRLLNL